MRTIGLFPFGGPGNPYTEMLAEAIAAAGFAPSRLQDTKFFPLRRACSSGVDALHLLWPGNLYHSSTRAGTLLKRMMFADGLRCLSRMPASYSADNLYPHDSKDVLHEIRMVQHIVNRVRAVTVATAAAETIFRQTYHIPASVRFFHVPHRHYIGKYPDVVSKAEARTRLGLPPDAPITLSLGRITPYKGLPGLVEAFVQADIPDSILLIAGSERVPGTVRAIQASVGRAGRPGSVRIHDRFIPDDEIQLYLRAADVMALSYEDVPMNPGSVLLAMSFALPVLCVRDGSVPEILGESLLGYGRNNHNELVLALRAALGDRAGLIERGALARRRAEDSHHPDLVAERFAACFEHVLS